MTERLREGFYSSHAQDGMNSDHPAAFCNSFIDRSIEGDNECVQRDVTITKRIESLLNNYEEYKASNESGLDVVGDSDGIDLFDVGVGEEPWLTQSRTWRDSEERNLWRFSSL